MCATGVVAGAVLCGACDVVWVTGWLVIGFVGWVGKVGKNVGGVWCTRSGCTELADAVDGANVADTATRAAAAPAHAASVAIGASRRRRALRLGFAGRMRRDTGRDSGSDAGGEKDVPLST